MHPWIVRAAQARMLVASTIVLTLGLLACAGPAATAEPSPAAGPTATAGPSMTAEPIATAEPALPGPPAAMASVEGGDPVTGQLGTYTWATTGSDSPWLHGAPMTVGAGEVLTIVFDPPVDVESWTARYVPRAQDGPEGAIVLNDGPPPRTFAVPPPGTWTVELAVVFTDDQGRASYAWSLAVE